jgi:hypothetical protein
MFLKGVFLHVDGVVAFAAWVEWVHCEGGVGDGYYVVFMKCSVVLAQGRDVGKASGCAGVASGYFTVNYG